MPLAVQACYGHEVSGEHAPADPLLEAFEPMAGTASQLHGALDHTDSAFDPVPETLAFFEPGPFLPALTPFVLVAGLRQDDVSDVQRAGQDLVLG